MQADTRGTGLTSLSQARLREVEELAELIAESSFPNSKIEPDSLARQEGITISFGHYADSFDGLLECKRGRFHIYCNLDRVVTRQSTRARFTLCHELGHYFLDEHRRGLASGKVASHPSLVEFVSDLLVEKEADAFAAALLMPGERTRTEFKRAGVGLPAVLEVADSLGVSVTAAGLRYVTLDVGPAAVIKWSAEGNRSWRFTSNSWRQDGVFGTGPAELAELTPDSPTAHTLSDSPPDGAVHAGSTLSTWFRSVKQGSRRDQLIVEHAIRLGRYGALTLLVPTD